MRRVAVPIVALALALPAVVAGALPSGEVILAYNGTDAVDVAMRATDGRNLTTLACTGDLSHDGSRRYLRIDDHAQVVVTDETCGRETTVLVSPDLYLDVARWSIDGRRVAVWGQSSTIAEASRSDPNVDPTGDPRAGVYVADVITDASGWPVGLTSLRQVVALAWTSWRSPALVSWAGDNTRIVYGYQPRTATGASGPIEVHVLDVETGSLTVIDDPAVAGHMPSFSPARDPVSGDYLIVMTRLTRTFGTVRNDLFVMRPDGTGLRQITDKRNAPASPMLNPTWSPDGTSVAYSALTTGKLTAYHVWRIAIDGSSKAIDLTPKAIVHYYVRAWRR